MKSSRLHIYLLLLLVVCSPTVSVAADNGTEAKQIATTDNYIFDFFNRYISSNDSSDDVAVSENIVKAGDTPNNESSKTSKNSDEQLLASMSSDSAVLPPPPPSTKSEMLHDNELKSALEYVYEHHPALSAKREELKAINEGVSQAVSGFRPSILTELNKGRTRNNSSSDTWGYKDSKSRSLFVNQPIFNGGATIAGTENAKERVEAARAELSALEQQTLYDTVVAYTDVVEKQALLELNQRNVDVLKQQYEASKARFDVGIITVTDVAQSSARLAAAQSAERQALGDLEVAKAVFRRVIGYDMPDKITMPPVPNGLPDTLEQAKTIAQSESPVLEAARRNEKAANENIYMQGSGILPSLALQGSMSRADGTSNTLGHLDSDAIKLTLSIPLYQSGAEWSRLRAAKNQAQQAKFLTIDTSYAVAESVTSAWEAFNTARAIINSNDSAVKAAQTALNSVRKENEFGIKTVLDVLDAEQEFFTASVNLLKAQRMEKVLAYRLLATIGQLTSKNLMLNTNVPPPQEHYDSVKYQLLGW